MRDSGGKWRYRAKITAAITLSLAVCAVLAWMAFPEIASPPRGIRLLAPVGGEEWAIGSTVAIEWDAGERSKPALVQLSRDGGETWEQLADLSKIRIRLCPWSVSGPASASCIVRVTDLSSGSQAASGVFKIASPAARRRYTER